MRIERAVLNEVELIQRGDLVKVKFPDGTTAQVIAQLTDRVSEQRRIIQAAGRGSV
jgi:hypothetical protein